MFSVGIIYSSRDFLKHAHASDITSEQFRSTFDRYKYASPEIILELCFKCGWLIFKPDGIVMLTDRGSKISQQPYIGALLLQLEDMIRTYNPPWASLIPKGRDETRHFLPESAKQCFKEAGLFDSLTDELVGFWDRLSLAYRNVKQEKLLELGRLGEKFSLAFEQERTGKSPKWQSIESNLSGYDIISTVDRGSSKKLMIEVKATSSHIDYASFHVSRNEWEAAKNTSEYVFHLWQIDGNAKTLYVTAKEIVETHIPIDSCDGQWESVTIPFRSLTTRSQEYHF